MPDRTYRVITRVVWHKMWPDRKLKIRSASSHSAFVAARDYWGLTTLTGLTLHPDRPECHPQYVRTDRMPAAKIL